jgi:hypothetical protein
MSITSNRKVQEIASDHILFIIVRRSLPSVKHAASFGKRDGELVVADRRGQRGTAGSPARAAAKTWAMAEVAIRNGSRRWVRDS